MEKLFYKRNQYYMRFFYEQRCFKTIRGREIPNTKCMKMPETLFDRKSNINETTTKLKTESKSKYHLFPILTKS